MQRRRQGRLRKLTATDRAKRQARRERNGKLTGVAKMQRHVVGTINGQPVYREWVRKPRRKLAPNWFAKYSRRIFG